MSGSDESDIWPQYVPVAGRSLWHARVHPVVSGAREYADWLWLFERASARQKRRIPLQSSDT